MKSKITTYLKKQIIIIIGLISGIVFSQTPVTYTSGPTNAEINAALIGNNITITGGTLNNGVRNDQIATFTGGNAAGLSMDTGAFFGTGLNNKLLIANNNLSSNGNPGGSTTYSDADLVAIDNNATNDVVSYSFSITLGPKASTLNIKYQFGSEEYPDYVGSEYDDAFGFFVTGPGITGTANLAKLPNGNNTTINKVNYGVPGFNSTSDPAYDGTQSSLYINNGHNTTVQSNGNLVENTNPGPFPIAVQFNGITKAITYTLSGLTPGGTYNFKIVIGDTGDFNYDSGVFINTIYATANLVANDDTYTVLSGSTTGGSVLNNDTVNGVSPASLSDVLLTQVSSSSPNVTLNTLNGEINVAAGTAPGVYTVTYQICDQTYTANCKTAIATVNVQINDSDNDGIDNYYDLDDDNDGVTDEDEENLCGSFTLPMTASNSSGTIITNQQITGAPSGFTFDVLADKVSLKNNNVALHGNNSKNSEVTFTFSHPVKIRFSCRDDSSVTGQFNYLDNNVTYSTTTPNANFVVYNPKITGQSAKFGSQSDADSDPNNSTEFFLISQSSTSVVIDPIPQFQLSKAASQWYIESTNYVNNFTVRKPGGDIHPFKIEVLCFALDTDADGDSIPNSLDLDSDNDGCPDAIEGSENVKYNQVNPLTASTNPGQINVIYDGSTIGTPAQIISTSAAANGVPQLVNKAGNNLNASTNPSNLAGVADNTDGTADVGQGIGDSLDNTLNSCKCYKLPSTDTNTYPTQHGITAFNRAGVDNQNWPMVRQSGWTALEASTKGFVINRMPASTTGVNAGEPVDGSGTAVITSPIAGMMFYDTTNDCLKVNVNGTRKGWKCFNDQTCPDEN